MEPHLGQYWGSVEVAIDEIARDNIIERIWKHDHTVWSPSPDEITNRLGWLHIARTMRENVPCLERLVQDVRADGYTHVLLLGMGGSSLAPQVFSQVFGGEGGLDLAVLDSTDPGAVLAEARRIDLARTLFIVSSKSGGTAETLSFFKHFYSHGVEELGSDGAGEHFVAITDQGTKLASLARALDFRAVFINDPNIGGRYSALSFFGLVPAALVGVDVTRLLDRALAMAESCGPSVVPRENASAQLGAILGQLARSGRDKVSFITSDRIAIFGDWVEQLIAESTGKSGTGILPVVREPLGAPEVYGDDRLFVYLQLDGDDTYDEWTQGLDTVGPPVVRITLRDTYDLGGQIFLWELATAVVGHRLGIHPFNQPNVEAAKVQARSMIAQYQQTGELPQMDSAPISAEVLKRHLEQPHAGAPSPYSKRGYIALQAFVEPTPETTAALQALRVRLRDRYRMAVTAGYGPRFLHSTGQLHKGDAGNGLFVQFTSDSFPDAPIPDEPGPTANETRRHPSMTFGVLKMAQALGDRRALEDAGRRVISIHLGEDVLEGLETLMPEQG
jgi:glucose-6-phosphate isomerase